MQMNGISFFQFSWQSFQSRRCCLFAASNWQEIDSEKKKLIEKGEQEKAQTIDVFFWCFLDMSHHRLNCKVVVTVVKGKHHNYPSLCFTTLDVASVGCTYWLLLPTIGHQAAGVCGERLILSPHT